MQLKFHSSTTYKSQDMEATVMLTDRGGWKGEEDVAHRYREILLSLKGEWNDAICSNMDAPKDYHSKWSQTETNTIYYLFVESKKTDTNKLIYKTGIDSQT